ncbi:TetR/AcrR family transcriptional regulator [Oceanicoccus sagamiensis]|uniref:TetR family transcriptional regulator n=1 Tax=Oceanicoccus sagamiensis TaxID=716816 RepID=A0A1X9N9K6_9GAMM|nr:TetR/AcrR family transcriptional regulator [Oceanicoccus sagamiensis]ARN73112.1 TetR family transcriptional regulator [Oceanicoccus sagamiensis]
MSERKQQILQAAIEIIAGQGYGSLTMRALARASDLKLGALQYHYKTRDDMLRALVGYIADEYRQSFELVAGEVDTPNVDDIVQFILDDSIDSALQSDKLWPQLWAMAEVEPLVADLVGEIYEEYLQIIERLFEAVGSKSPRAEALFILSLVEGTTLFVGSGRPWQAEKETVREAVVDYVQSRFNPGSKKALK